MARRRKTNEWATPARLFALGFGGGVAFRSSITLFRRHRVWKICIFAVGRRGLGRVVCHFARPTVAPGTSKQNKTHEKKHPFHSLRLSAP